MGKSAHSYVGSASALPDSNGYVQQVYFRNTVFVYTIIILAIIVSLRFILVFMDGA